MAELQAIPGATPAMQAFVQQVRLYLRDFPELNRLTAGEETSDRMIAWATLDALSAFSGTPPFIGTFSLEDLLQNNQMHLLTRMTVEAIIESVALLQTRNHINYSTGGINVGVNDKTPLLMSHLQYYKAYTSQMLQHVKVALNIANILGPSQSGVYSEYFRIHASYMSY
jgi:hypothetical protein